jgi:hypothetical protein
MTFEKTASDERIKKQRIELREEKENFMREKQ